MLKLLMFNLLIIVPLLFVIPVSAKQSAKVVLGIPTISDGDTIRIEDKRIRLNGIDAPESKQMCRRADGSAWYCGWQATLTLSSIIDIDPVWCQWRNRDRYRRPLATCYRDGVDINDQMIRAGYALAFRRYSKVYVFGEADAMARKAGMWQGTFTAPWVWRRQKR